MLFLCVFFGNPIQLWLHTCAIGEGGGLCISGSDVAVISQFGNGSLGVFVF